MQGEQRLLHQSVIFFCCCCHLRYQDTEKSSFTLRPHALAHKINIVLSGEVDGEVTQRSHNSYVM